MRVAFDNGVGKTDFVSHQNPQRKQHKDQLHSWEITYDLKFWNKEQKAYLDAMKFKNRTWEYHQSSSQFHMVPKMSGLSISS